MSNTRKNDPSKKRKRSVRLEDRAYTNKRKRSKSHESSDESTFHLRTLNEKVVVMETGEEAPLKTASILNADNIEGLSPTKVKQHFIPSTPSNRPIKKIIPRIVTSPGGTITTGSPVAVETPQGTRLSKRTNIGLLETFSNIPQPDFGSIENLLDINLSLEFYDSEEYQNIQKMLKNITQKEQEIIVTKKILEQSRREFQQSGNKRHISQNAVMVKPGIQAKYGSANKYVNAAIKYELYNSAIKCEWLHLIAHMFQGKTSQNIQNLVAGNYHTNTEMMAAEEVAKQLAKHYSQGIRLSVIANIIPKTHIAKTIFYRIITPDFTLNFKFNAFSPNKPHASLATEVKDVVTACLKTTEEKKAFADNKMQVDPDQNKENPLVNHSIFREKFSKKPIHATKVTTVNKNLNVLKTKKR